jgi:hypothetical protein
MWGDKEEGIFKPRAVNEAEAERDRATPTCGGGGWSTHTHERDAHGHSHSHTWERERDCPVTVSWSVHGVVAAQESRVVSIRS